MEPTREKRRLSAIVFTDIVGYSRKMEADEVRMLRLLDDHCRLVEPIAARHDGEIIKRVGDAFLISFDSAVNAVRCALDIQQAHQEYNADKPESDRVLVRIGIHLGDIVLREGDVFGDGVNIASRVQPLAEPGGICVTRTVYDVVKKKLDVKAVELGPQQLKNIEEAVEVFHLLTGTVSVRKTRMIKLRRNSILIGAIVVSTLVVIAVSLREDLFGPKTYSSFEYQNDSRVVALKDSRGRLFKAISFPNLSEKFTSVTIVEPITGESVKCLMTIEGSEGGYGYLICLDATGNIAFMDSIRELEVPMDSVLTESGPELVSWTHVQGYRCLGSWLADVDGESFGREIIARFYNYGFFADCIKVYQNKMNKHVVAQVWNRGGMGRTAFYDIVGDSAKEILRAGNLNWQVPYLKIVYALTQTRNGHRPDTPQERIVYDPRGIVSTGWDNLLWVDIIPFPTGSDTSELMKFDFLDLAASDKGKDNASEIVVKMSDGGIYWLAGDGKQTRFVWSDWSRIRHQELMVQPDVLRITQENVDSLLAGLFDEQLYLRLAP